MLMTIYAHTRQLADEWFDCIFVGHIIRQMLHDWSNQSIQLNAFRLSTYCCFLLLLTVTFGSVRFLQFKWYDSMPLSMVIAIACGAHIASLVLLVFFAIKRFIEVIFYVTLSWFFDRLRQVDNLKHSQSSLWSLQFGSKHCIFAIHRLHQLWKEVQAKRLADWGGVPTRSMEHLIWKNVRMLSALKGQKIYPQR